MITKIVKYMYEQEMPMLVLIDLLIGTCKYKITYYDTLLINRVDSTISIQFSGNYKLLLFNIKDILSSDLTTVTIQFSSNSLK